MTLNLRRLSVAVLVAVVVTGLLVAHESSIASAQSAIPSTVHIGSIEKVAGLDVSLDCCETTYEISLLTNAYLTSYGVQGGVDRDSIASAFTPSKNGMSWTVKLKPGIKFSNSVPLTASDVVASLDYGLRPTGAASYLGRNIKAMKAVNPQTVRITMVHPDPTLPELLSAPDQPIYPASGIEHPKTFFNHPVGAGAYTLASMDLATGQFVLKRNPTFFGAKPKVAEVDISNVPSMTTLLAQLKTGAINYALGLQPSLKPQLTGNLRAITVPYTSNIMLFPIFKKGSLLLDPKIRAAIADTVNRRQMSTSLGGFLPPQYGFYPNTSGLDHVAASSPNLQKAKALLAGTKCASGCTLNLGAFSTQWFSQDVLLILQQQLAKIGIKVKILNPTQAAKADADNTGLDAVADYAVPFHDASLSWMDHTLRSKTAWGAITGLDNATADHLANEFDSATSSRQAVIANKIDSFVQKSNVVIPLLEYRRLDATTLPAGSTSVVDAWKLKLP